jgi:hypothetical protein
VKGYEACSTGASEQGEGAASATLPSRESARVDRSIFIKVKRIVMIPDRVMTVSIKNDNANSNE